jgi:tetratricopeptide (TPR) repeat protein
MKIRQCIHILAVLLLITGFVLPVMAAENETADAATAFYNSGVLLLEEKEYARAIAAFDQALASNTTMIRWSDALLYTYQNKAYALIQLNNYTAAVQTIDQGLAVYENDEKLWYNKGFALFKLGNYQDAITAYDKVLQIGRYQDAVDSYIRANEKDPGNSYASAGLEKAQRALAAGTPPTTAPSQTIIPTTLPANTQSSLTPTIVPTAIPTNTKSPLSPLPIVAALTLMGLLSIVLMKKR